MGYYNRKTANRKFAKRKPRYYRKRNGTKSMYNIAKKVVNRVMPPIEYKIQDFAKSIDFAGGPGGAQDYSFIGGIAQGLGGEGRIGDKLAVHSMTCGLRVANHMVPGGTEGDYNLDITLRATKKIFWAWVLEKDCYGGTFDYTKVWEDWSAVPRFRVKENLRKYTVLKSGTFTLDPDSGPDWKEKTFHITFKKPIVVQYNNTDANETSISKNKIVFFAGRYCGTTAYDESEVLNIVCKSRARYTDV